MSISPEERWSSAAPIPEAILPQRGTRSCLFQRQNRISSPVSADENDPTWHICGRREKDDHRKANNETMYTEYN